MSQSNVQGFPVAISSHPKKRASRLETRDILRQISGGRHELERFQNVSLHQNEVARHLVKSLSKLWLAAECAGLTREKELLEFAFYESFVTARTGLKNRH